jgi:hypothetical protein
MTAATPAGKAPAGKAPTGSAPAPRALIGRAVIWAGLAAGTAATVLAVMHGIRIPGLQVVLSVILTWLLLIVVAVTVAELLRRHHRAAARHAWRHGKRGALFAGRHTRRGAGAAGGYLTRKAAVRWQARQQAPRPVGQQAGRPVGADGRPIPDGERYGTMGDPDVQRALRDGIKPVPPPRTPPPPPPPPPPPERKTTMAHTTIVGDGNAGGGTFSGAWRQVIADTAEFEPEDDGHLLAWMAAEVNGMSAYAEALTEVYETCVNTVGLDPVAMNATHDVADAAAEAASAMAGARSKFASHYGEVREFAANGGLLPFDGRWITGDGDA